MVAASVTDRLSLIIFLVKDSVDRLINEFDENRVLYNKIPDNLFSIIKGSTDPLTKVRFLQTEIYCIFSLL